MIGDGLRFVILVHLADGLIIAAQVIIPLPQGEDATQGQSRRETGGTERGRTRGLLMVRAEVAVQSEGVGAGAGVRKVTRGK